jgi:hypothetical protein
MDASYVSALSALAGTLVGGITSFATTFVTQHTLGRAERRARDLSARQELYGKFLEELARIYSHAIREEHVNHDGLISIFALRGRILLLSSQPVVDAADTAIRVLIDTMLAPNKTEEELRDTLKAGRADEMVMFAQTCRAELQQTAR